MALLDALDALPRSNIRQNVWRTVKNGRDPLEAGKSKGRWGHDRMETLYTSFEEKGAVAEIYALLSLQPVFPSKIQWSTFKIQVELEDVCSLPSLTELAALGLDVGRYRQREYDRTQDIADAALFLGFTGLVIPSARWDCSNLVVFAERVDIGELNLVGSPIAVDWDQWRADLRATR